MAPDGAGQCTESVDKRDPVRAGVGDHLAASPSGQSSIGKCVRGLEIPTQARIFRFKAPCRQYWLAMKQPGLLAYLSSRFARSEEDCATEALTFLLSGCPEARNALHGYVRRSFQVELAPHLIYRSQQADPEKGRPDVVGTDPTGGHQLIIEAKFWAGLTSKQPGAYLTMLSPGGPGVVLVVAPATRLLTLWPELLANLAAYTGEPEGERLLGTDHEPGRYELVMASGHILALRSWQDVQDEIDRHLRVAGSTEWLADLAQLRTLTDRMDQTGFLPLLAEDLDTRSARQISSLFPLVRRLAGEFSTEDRLEQLSGKHSYEPLYFGWWLRSKVSNVRIWAGLYLRAWTDNGCSPLWAEIYPNVELGWTMPVIDRVLETLQLPAGAGRWEDEAEPGGAYLIPLMLSRTAVEDDVIADLKVQLSAIAQVLDGAAGMNENVID
jgi:hypothetical protein